MRFCENMVLVLGITLEDCINPKNLLELDFENSDFIVAFDSYSLDSNSLYWQLVFVLAYLPLD